MDVNKQHVEAAVNAVREAHDAWAEASARDAAFDGGEFSGPACARMLEAALGKVAEEYGFGSYFDIIAAAEAGGLMEGYEAHCYRMMLGGGADV